MKASVILTILFFVFIDSIQNELYSRNQVEFPKNTMALMSDPEFYFIKGTWQGNLRNKKITIVIERISNRDVFGYNIVGKNKRPLKGKILNDDRQVGGECHGQQVCFKLILNEPGDDQWDGVFKIYFLSCPETDENDNIIAYHYSAYGIWNANNGKLNGEINLNKN
jgi:hypothetical protein